MSEVAFVDGVKPQEKVTMNRPLEPWHAGRFAKALSMHIHQATRTAGHGHESENFGIMDTETNAKRWDAAIAKGLQ